MALIDMRERTLLLKLVYYGPAMCGKTTNLRVLHGLLDPSGRPDLLSLDTQGDRTLFFDLLPLELGDVGGLRMKVRLFTVPGQVHYNATRRLVLRDADAAIFVADSLVDRLAANGESLRSLHDNLVANGVRPGTVPFVIQANKRDLAAAVPVADVLASLDAEVLKIHSRAVVPGLVAAAAVDGRGVFETFEKAVRAALAAAYESHGLARAGLTREALGFALSEALGPMRARALAAARVKPAATSDRAAPAATSDRAAPAATSALGAAAANARDCGSRSRPSSPAVVAGAERVLPGEELLEESVRRAVDLAETLGEAQVSSLALARRVRELQTLQEFSHVLVRATTLQEVSRATAFAARTTLGDKGAASLLLPDGRGGLHAAGLAGLVDEPLLRTGSPPLAIAIHRGARAIAYKHVEMDLALGDAALASMLTPWCTLVACPVPLPGGGHGMLVAYGQDPGLPADPAALRFASLVATQAALGLQAVDRHLRLEAHGERLESEVVARTAELQAAHAELAASSRLKDRILISVNHELRTPVTKLLAAAQVLQRVKEGSAPPQMLQQVIAQARHLATLLDQVLAAHALLSDDAPSHDVAGCLDLARTVEAAVLASQDRAVARGVLVQVEPPGERLVARADAGAVTLILAQLLDNAVKFTKAGTTVRVSTEAAADGAVRVLVRDQGPGVRPEDAARIFAEFDQGSADVLTAKPSGLGLGLAIARRLARRLGGDVGTLQVANGALFWLALPAAQPQPQTLLAAPSRLLAAPGA